MIQNEVKHISTLSVNDLIVSIKRERDMDWAKTNSRCMRFKTKWDRKKQNGERKERIEIYLENANQRKKGEQY